MSVVGGTSPWRIGLVDDHEVVESGVCALLATCSDLDLVAVAPTVSRLLGQAGSLDLVMLDLRLADGTNPEHNVRALRRAGAHVLVFTVGDEPALVRSAARAGALGVVRKSKPLDVLLSALRTAVTGAAVMSTEFATALDGDPSIANAGLSAREREVLALYASGEKSQRVASLTGLALPTVKEYVDRIRAKYAHVDRSAPTKVDLYRRAVEDGLLPAPVRR